MMGRRNLFKLVGGVEPPKDVKVVFVGFPGGRYGYVKNAPRSVRDNKTWWTLRREYRTDLGYPLYQDSFDLRPWLSQGIWVFPTQLQTGSHKHTKRMDRLFRKLNRNYGPIAFVFIGGEYIKYANRLDTEKHLVLTVTCRTSGKQSAQTYLVGSRLFTTISEFHKMSKSMWKLPIKV